MSSKLIESLNILLADTYSLYLKTQNYHWNITGRHFPAMHQMLEDQYKDLADAVDEIAERIRMLDHKSPGTFDEFIKLRTIGDANSSFSEKEMIGDLIMGQTNIHRSLNNVLSAARDANDAVTEDLAIGRMSMHEKTKWMLAATIDN